MPKFILTSRESLWDGSRDEPHPGVREAVAAITAERHDVVVVSRRPEPTRFHERLPGVTFHSGQTERQRKGYVDKLIEANRASRPYLARPNFLVLGCKNADLQMAKNNDVVLVRAGWVPAEDQIAKYGVALKRPMFLPRAVGLLETKHPWYFQHRSDRFTVLALTNASTINQPDEIARVAGELRGYLKTGTDLKPGVLLHLLSSVALTEEFKDTGLFGFYPGSNPRNDDGEVIAGFTHIVREEASRVRFAKKGVPLFIRHASVAKRHTLPSGDRTDVRGQLMSVHLNPEYRKKLREGPKVVVLDDYTTYGASFGVAAALLRRAGASAIIAVAMGKFGGCARLFDIEVTGDPFRPLTPNDFKVGPPSSLSGDSTDEAQLEFVRKFAAGIE